MLDNDVLEGKRLRAAIGFGRQREGQLCAGSQERGAEGLHNVVEDLTLYRHRVVQRSRCTACKRVRVRGRFVGYPGERRPRRSAVDTVRPGERVARLEVAHGAHVDRQDQNGRTRDVEHPGGADRAAVLRVLRVDDAKELVQVVVVDDAERVGWEDDQAVVQDRERNRRRDAALVFLEAVTR